MTRTQAIAYGAAIGATAALSWGLLHDAPWSAMLYRAFVLAIAGAWIGFLLAWLDALLPAQGNSRENAERKPNR